MEVRRLAGSDVCAFFLNKCAIFAVSAAKDGEETECLFPLGEGVGASFLRHQPQGVKTLDG